MSYNNFRIWAVGEEDSDLQIASKEKNSIQVNVPPYEEPEDAVVEFYHQHKVQNDTMWVATRWIQDEQGKPVPKIFQNTVRVRRVNQETLDSPDDLPSQGKTIPSLLEDP